jgi:hypothetical protein
VDKFAKSQKTLLAYIFFSETKALNCLDTVANVKENNWITLNELPIRLFRLSILEAMCIVYISMFMFILDAYAAEPWYLGILSYPLP